MLQLSNEMTVSQSFFFFFKKGVGTSVMKGGGNALSFLQNISQ
jgi:hypothetical protein